MRTEMHKALNEEQMREDMTRRVSERTESAEILLTEKWEKNRAFGAGIKELHQSDVRKAHNLAFVLEHQENHLANMSEDMISSIFKTTPENVMKIVRLGYPNSCRADIFTDWGMESYHDSMYYIHQTYGKTKRGATAGEHILESSEYRYPTEVEIETLGTGDASETDFTATLSKVPARPFTVKVLVDGTPVATDDGVGNFIGTGVSGTVNYETGAVSVTFTTAPASGAELEIAFNFDSEVAARYSDIGNVEIQLKGYDFYARQKPLYVHWTKLIEILLGTSFNIDAEEELVAAAADEFKKSQDFEAIAKTWAVIKNRTSFATFNCQSAVGEPEIDRMNAFTKALGNASDLIYNKLNRGGVTTLVGGPKAVNQVMLHSRFDASNAQPAVGVYRVGSLDGVDIYKAPTSLIDDDCFMTVFKNPLNINDTAAVFATLIPLYTTDKLEFKEFYKEFGLASYGDSKILNPDYLQKIKLLNIPA